MRAMWTLYDSFVPTEHNSNCVCMTPHLQLVGRNFDMTKETKQILTRSSVRRGKTRHALRNKSQALPK